MKKNIFEYVNLKKETAKSREGKEYIKYIVVSDVPKETNKVKDKLKQLGFHAYKPNKYSWEGFYWYIYGNELNRNILDGLKQINAELQGEGDQTENIDDFVAKIENLKDEITGSDLPRKTKEQLEASISQYIDDIANATDSRAADAEMQRFLDFSHRFHNYSFSNLLLIYLQDRDATKVAGERAWEKNFNRKVVDKTKSIWIWCINKYFVDPKTGKSAQYSLDQQKKDNEYISKVQSGQIPLDQTEMDKIKARKRITGRSFNPCEVYDVANTTGDPIPEEPKWMGDYDNRADATALFNIAKKSLETLGVKVTLDPAMDGEGGYSTKGRINITQGAKGTGAASTIFHEWAHELLHQETGKFYSKTMEYFEKKGQLTYGNIKQIKEIQAETVSAVLCKHYGLPSEHHATYMALWQSQGKLSSKDLIKENISTITEVSNFIIHEIDKYKDEFEKVGALTQNAEK